MSGNISRDLAEVVRLAESAHTRTEKLAQTVALLSDLVTQCPACAGSGKCQACDGASGDCDACVHGWCPRCRVVEVATRCASTRLTRLAGVLDRTAETLRHGGWVESATALEAAAAELREMANGPETPRSTR